MEEEMVTDTTKTASKIMIIDNDVNMMDVLSVILKKYGHTITAFTEPASALEELKRNKYDILIVNYLMSPVNGNRIVELVREFNKEIYIIFMSNHKDLAPSIQTMQNLDIQAYIEKSSRFDQLIICIQSGIKYNEQINKVKSMGIQMEQYLLDFAKILLNTIEAKDNYTKEHSRRVSNLAVYFGKYLSLSPKELEDLKTAGLFHDIGKIGIPDNVLMKQGRLSDDEFDTIKSHPVIGANILGVSNLFKDVSPIIYSHHERIDGKGYPENLKGEEIPYLARLLTLCDSFDAILSKRPYKEQMSIEHGIEQIEFCKGTQFDTDLSNKFIEMIKTHKEEIEEIMNKGKV